jgi:hypothetical protein
MGDKANSAAQQYVWAKIQEIGSALGAPLVLGTAGNHDMDSRYTNDYDARGALQSLTPRFPGLDEAACDRYWSRNYVIHEESDWRIVILNSAAYHGARAPKGDEHAGSEEFERGRISLRTVASLGSELSALSQKPLNILLCHHHPVRNAEIPPSKDYSEMVSGDVLLNKVSELDIGDWIFVHGHKHYPRIWYAGGSSGKSPVIMSAGSFSARLYSEIAGFARNQFYIVDFPLLEIERERTGVLGRIAAWDWTQSYGWQEARPGSGIHHQSGFGWRENPNRVAKEVAEEAAKLLIGGVQFIGWEKLEHSIPLLRYLSPDSMHQLTNALKSTHALTVLFEGPRPNQLGRTT